MKLSIVFPVLNQFPLSRVAIEHAIVNLSGEYEAEVLVIDNGSDIPFDMKMFGMFAIPPKVSTRIIRNEKSTGVYPTMWQGLKETTGDIILFLHTDLIIAEKDYDKRLVEAFELHPKTGLIGFVGSNEIDGSGGRGSGTTSNFLGYEYFDRDELGKERSWKGSNGALHGQVSALYSNASVVDGCAMAFRRFVLSEIPQRDNFPPHHFYDRLLSCEVLEKGYHVGVLGIGCDHISGQTVNQEQKYHDMGREWLESHGYILPDDGNMDAAIYRIAEKMWLGEYRDVKHLVPCKVK